MVKVRGPLGSAEASGGFGPSAVFSSWKGRSYVKSHAVPTNPKSALQTTVRAMMGFLSQQWASIADEHKATWETLALDLEIPPYNAFISHNLERWRQFTAPGQRYPVTEGYDLPNATFVSATGGVGHAVLEFSMTNPKNNWGILIFRGTDTPTIGVREKCIAALLQNTIGTHYYTDQNLPPDNYYYIARYFTTRGKLGGNTNERNAWVT